MNTRGVIYPYEILNNKALPFSEEYLKIKFPNAYGYLTSWKDELLQRDKGGIGSDDWYKWGRVQSMIPTRNKLLTKTFNRGPCFYYDTTDSLFSNGYAITPFNANYSIDFIRLVLNSDIFFYYAKLTSFEIVGEYQCYQKNFIERFCLPTISCSEQLAWIDENTINKNLREYYKLNYKSEDF